MTVGYIWNTKTNEVFEIQNPNWQFFLFETEWGREALEDFEWFEELVLDWYDENGHPDYRQDVVVREWLPWFFNRLREFVGTSPQEDFRVLYEFSEEMDYAAEEEEIPHDLLTSFSSTRSHHWRNGELPLRIPFRQVGSCYERDYDRDGDVWTYKGDDGP